MPLSSAVTSCCNNRAGRREPLSKSAFSSGSSGDAGLGMAVVAVCADNFVSAGIVSLNVVWHIFRSSQEGVCKHKAELCLPAMAILMYC